MRDYAVDPQRVYVAGLSAGGAAAAVMGDDLSRPVCRGRRPFGPRLWRRARHDIRLRGHAAAAVRGAPAKRHVPVIVFHGDRDTTVNPRNGDAVAAQAARGESLRTHTREGHAPGGYRYTRTVRTDAAGDTAIEQWTVHGAGHAWSGGHPAGSFTDPKGPDATKEMLRFFLEHSRRA